MPIHRNPDGTWQWGKSGKKYKKKADAIKQMQAIFANGYRELGHNKKAAFLYKLADMTQQNMNLDSDIFPKPLNTAAPVNAPLNFRTPVPKVRTKMQYKQPKATFKQVKTDITKTPAYNTYQWGDASGTKTANRGDTVQDFWRALGQPGTFADYQNQFLQNNGTLDIQQGKNYNLGKYADV